MSLTPNAWDLTGLCEPLFAGGCVLYIKKNMQQFRKNLPWAPDLIWINSGKEGQLYKISKVIVTVWVPVISEKASEHLYKTVSCWQYTHAWHNWSTVTASWTCYSLTTHRMRLYRGSWLGLVGPEAMSLAQHMTYLHVFPLSDNIILESI